MSEFQNVTPETENETANSLNDVTPASETPISSNDVMYADTDQTVTDVLDSKADRLSPALLGAPTAPTPASSDDSTRIATTAFVKNVRGVMTVNSLFPDENGDVQMTAGDVNAAAANHTHTGYAPASHTHENYAGINHTHENYADVGHTHSGFAAENHSHDGYAPAVHDHDGYAAEDHSHDEEYAALNHSHTGFAAETHTHTAAAVGASPASHTHAEYAAANHTHSGFASSTHDHDEDYAATSHTHSNYAASNHTHTASAVGAAAASHTHDYAATTHNHDSAYAAKSHTHDYAASGHTHSNYAASSHSHNAATTSAAGFMSTSDKSKLDGIASGANKTTVDSALSSTSTNPVQNKVINSALAGKAAASHSHDYAASSHTHTPSSIGAAAASHTHSYAATNHTHSDYAASSHTHTAANVGALSTSGGTVNGDVNIAGILRVNGQQSFYFQTSTMSQTVGTNNATGGTTICCGADATVNVNGALMKTATVIPKTTNAYYCGNANFRWKGIYSTSAVNVSSDERLKRNITELDAKALAAFVNGLNVVSYNYKDDEADRKARIGLVAQQVQQADPELAKFFVGEDEGGMLNLTPADLVFPLIAAVQQLSARVAELEAAK